MKKSTDSEFVVFGYAFERGLDEMAFREECEIAKRTRIVA
jgi:hypothetical protein